MLPALRQLSERLGLGEGAPLPDGVALKAWALEEQWRRDDGTQRPARDRRVRSVRAPPGLAAACRPRVRPPRPGPGRSSQLMSVWYDVSFLLVWVCVTFY